MDASRTDPERSAARLGLADAVSLIVGIIIGVGIFRAPADVFGSVPGPAAGLFVWACGGAFAFVGALCFAELASTYPRSGGEYVYLTRAFGPLVGYLFAWAQLTVIRPGSIAALAYVFADYFAKFLAGAWDGGTLNDAGVFLTAAGVIAAMTAVNVLGVTLSANTQNVLTVAKVLGLAGLVVVGFAWGRPAPAVTAGPPAPPPTAGWFVAVMVFVLWTYAGWHEAAYIASEVKHPTRNLPLALLLGTAAVTLIYLAVNAAYLRGLGFAGARSKTLAADLLALVWPGYGGTAMALLVVVSALGAINGTIFTTARIYSVFGADHRLFAPLSHWSRRLGTPVRALLVQGVICLGLIGIVATVGQGEDSFEVTVNLTAAVFWAFFLLTGLALLRLRAVDPDRPRPFRAPLSPALPVVFCGGCAYMMFGAIGYAPGASLVGLGILLIGLPFYFVPPKKRRQTVHEELQPVPK